MVFYHYFSSYCKTRWLLGFFFNFQKQKTGISAHLSQQKRKRGSVLKQGFGSRLVNAAVTLREIRSFSCCILETPGSGGSCLSLQKSGGYHRWYTHQYISRDLLLQWTHNITTNICSEIINSTPACKSVI